MNVGLYMMLGKRMRGEVVAIGDVFKGFQKFGPAFLLGLILGIALGVLYAVLFVFTAVIGSDKFHQREGIQAWGTNLLEPRLPFCCWPTASER